MFHLSLFVPPAANISVIHPEVSPAIDRSEAAWMKLPE
uniref:Uncharacterized protein n=2 Tax=Salmonella enterica I TaxID=59201 RepID=A0A0H3VVH4_SALTM|nr:hypothetical protein pSH111_227_196 [Salmonella enterica subsp. enterica serovar Heidelberg]AKG90094.1 hypothetical protein [Salmonella enterica subsp. enterica serovar Typhimurium]